MRIRLAAVILLLRGDLLLFPIALQSDDSLPRIGARISSVLSLLRFLLQAVLSNRLSQSNALETRTCKVISAGAF